MIVQYLRGTEILPRANKGKSSEAFVRGKDLKSMSTDELWKFHEEVIVELDRKIKAEKTKLEQRQRLLHAADKRPYPPVHPKYRNPKNPKETWSGRGHQPRWLGALIQAGRRLDDFLIERGPTSAVRNATTPSTTTNSGSRSSARALRG
jgi:DNA-binding protein H-NS